MAHYDPPSAIPTAQNPFISVADAITATGTAQAGGYPVTKAFTVFTTVASGAGALLSVAPNQEFGVTNLGANALLVYPPVGAAINGGSVNAPGTLAAGASGSYLCVSATRIVKTG